MDHLDELRVATASSLPLNGLAPRTCARDHATFEALSNQRGLIADWLVDRLSSSRTPVSLDCGRHRTLCGMMGKLRARMADMGIACYLCAWPVLKRGIGRESVGCASGGFYDHYRCDCGTGVHATPGHVCQPSAVLLDLTPCNPGKNRPRTRCGGERSRPVLTLCDGMPEGQLLIRPTKVARPVLAAPGTRPIKDTPPAVRHAKSHLAPPDTNLPGPALNHGRYLQSHTHRHATGTSRASPKRQHNAAPSSTRSYKTSRVWAMATTAGGTTRPLTQRRSPGASRSSDWMITGRSSAARSSAVPVICGRR
jgi:hypothetical protein